jgi:O-antigen ligase
VAYGLLLFSWWEAKDPRYKAAAFVTLGVAALAMVLTFSRAGMLAFMLVNALFLLWKLNARTVALAIIAGGIAMALAPEYLWNRITFGWSGDANMVSANRIDEIWGPLLPELWNSPVWGNGLGAIMWSEPLLNGEMMRVSHAHNAYLDAFYDMGAIGLTLMLLFYWHVWKGFRALGSNAYLSPELRGFFQGATAVLVAFFVTGMSGSSLKPDLEFGFLWVAIGMMYGMLARRPAG